MINKESMYQELYQWTLQNANKYFNGGVFL